MPLTLLGVQVPDYPNANQEICHQFTVNYLICRNQPRRLVYANLPPNTNALQMLVQEIQRQNLAPQAIGNPINPGDLILIGNRDANGMLRPAHSMIAITQALWFGVNNLGTFGNLFQQTNIPANSLSARREIDLGNLLPLANFNIPAYQINLPGIGILDFDVYR